MTSSRRNCRLHQWQYTYMPQARTRDMVISVQTWIRRNAPNCMIREISRAPERTTLHLYNCLESSSNKRTVENDSEEVRPILLEVFEEHVLSSSWSAPGGTTERKIISLVVVVVGVDIVVSAGPKETRSPARRNRDAVAR